MADMTAEELTRRIRKGEATERADLAEVDLRGLSLEGAKLPRCVLSGGNLEDTLLRNAKLEGAALREVFAAGADFSDADLEGADLEGAMLRGARFVGANLTRANLEGADLSDADFTGARLLFAQLDGAKLGGAKLGKAVMRHAIGLEAYFGGADLTEADLRHATLSRANLEEANLTGALADHATLDDVRASGSTWSKASLVKADLRRAHLVAADMRDADARHADFTGAKLDLANMTGARIAHVVGTGTPVENVQVLWADTSSRGDGSERLTNGKIPLLLSGLTPITSEAQGERYIGPGDVVREASLRFAEGARARIDGRCERCAIHLGDGAELVIGEGGILADCTVEGSGRIVVEGRFYEGRTPGIVGPRELIVRSRGVVVAAVKQGSELASLAFEPGSRLRMKVLRPES